MDVLVVSKGCMRSVYHPRFKVDLNHCARFVFLSRAIDQTDSHSHIRQASDATGSAGAPAQRLFPPRLHQRLFWSFVMVLQFLGLGGLPLL